MLVYTINKQKDTLVTLTESTTILNAYYLFVFTNVVTKEVKKAIVNSADDSSDYPERINIFAIDVSSLFSTSKAGQWSYDVYEQEDSTNLDPDGLNLVECGKMLLLPENSLNKQGYGPTTTYTGYSG